MISDLKIVNLRTKLLTCIHLKKQKKPKKQNKQTNQTKQNKTEQNIPPPTKPQQNRTHIIYMYRPIKIYLYKSVLHLQHNTRYGHLDFPTKHSPCTFSA